MNNLAPVPEESRPFSPAGKGWVVIWRALGAIAVTAGLLLHLGVMVCHAGRWDWVSAVTVFPIWMWALGGLALGGIARLAGWRRSGSLVLLLWAVVFLSCPDEWRPLWRGMAQSSAAPPPGPPPAGRWRVVSLNCRKKSIDAAREVAAWKPDVALFQEMGGWQEAALKALAREWWGAEGQAVVGPECAILARGGLIPRLTTPPSVDEQFVQATLHRPDGQEIELVSIHLQRAVTDMRLWRWETWREHSRNHRSRRLHLADAMNYQLRIGGLRPCLMAGDFNAPANDRIFRTLMPHFRDVFPMAAVGWPDTYPNGFPLLRIDQMWVTPELKPSGARAVRTVHSDHRMVVVDF